MQSVLVRAIGVLSLCALGACVRDEATSEAGAGGTSGGGAPTAGAGGAGGGESCNGEVGFVEPRPVCSPESPCTNTPPSLPSMITSASDPPTCKTAAGANHPDFSDPAPLSRMDEAGVMRWACLYTPPGASRSSKRPLLIFFHGSFGSADDVYNFTSLRAKAPSYDLSGDPARAGYFLLAIGARNLHWPTSNEEDGSKHDIFYRDLGSPSLNPDLANFDAFVDQLVAGGSVDPDRIYTTGWSNGGRFAQLVAIARHQTATPGGNRVAATAVYSATDPFNMAAVDEPGCALDPYPKSPLPVALVGRSCDILPCDEAQAADLVSDGLPIVPGDVMGTWASDLENEVGSTAVLRIIVAGTGAAVTGCTGSSCNQEIALWNHVRWPDGVADESGVDHEPAMLDFLRQNHLP